MSGIEVAGIVLAVLGALIKGVGGYGKVVTGRDVRLLEESLKDNKIIFSSSVGHLLRSTVTANELTRLMNDTLGNTWTKNSLDERMIAYLGAHARNIISKLDDIYNTLSQLQKKVASKPPRPLIATRNMY